MPEALRLSFRLSVPCSGVKGEPFQLMLIVSGESEIVEDHDVFLCLQ